MDYTIINGLPLQSPQAPKAFYLILAENGTLHEYPLSKFVSSLSTKEPYALMNFIEKEFSIPSGDQVIIRAADGKQLEISMNLKEFFEKDQTIHVFDKRFYREETSSDDFEVINSISPGKNDWSELKLDYLPELYETYLQVDIKKWLNQSLIEKGEEVMTTFCDVSNEIRSLKEASIKLKRQKDSESVAKKNLMGYYVEKKKKFDETFSLIKNKFTSFQTIFDEFDSYLDNLAKIEINPQLAERGKKYLIDYFNVGKVKSNKIAYEKNQGKIILKCNEIEKEILEYDDHLKKMEEDIPDYYFEIISLIQVQETRLSELHNTSLQSLQDLLLREKESMFSTYLNRFISQEWEMTLPKLRDIFQSLQQIRSQLEGHLKDNAIKLKGFVSDVANIQLVIREKLQNRHTVFRSLVEKHEKDMFSLKALAEFPAVYQASVDEIQRRYRSKEDCLTILNILQNFTASENSLRQEFMQRYGAYLPNSFCPMLSKGFPHINFEYLQKVVNEDESFALEESLSSSSSMNEHGKVLQLLKTINNTAKSKEFRIQELEDMLKIQAENLSKFRAQLKSRTLEACDLNELLEKNGFQDQVNSIVENLNEKYKTQVKNLEDKLENLQTSRIEPFESVMKKIKDEIKETLPDTDGKSVVEAIRDIKKEYNANISRLTRQLEERRVEKQNIIDHLENIEEKMQRLSMENRQAKEEKAELKELSRILNEKISEKELVEASLREMVTNLKQSLTSDQDTIISLGRDLNEREKENESLAQEIESLTHLHHIATGIIREKEEIVDECKNQIVMLWEGLAEKENEICNIQNLVEAFKKEMDYVRLQNNKLEELMQSKDNLLEEMKGKIEGQQMKVIVFQDILTAKGQEVDEVKGSLNLCQEELENLLAQKNNIEKDLKCLREENEHLKSEKANLVSVVQQTRENWQESEESRRDLQYTLRKRGVQIEVLEVEKRRYMDMLEAVRKEKEILRETITKEISLQFSQNMQRLEDHLKVRDQEVELLQEIVLKYMPSEVERLANGDGEPEDGRQCQTNLIEAEKEDDKGKEYKDMSTDCDCSQSMMSNRLLGEFGESILQLYTTLLGKYGESLIYNKSIDLQEIMVEIPKLIKDSMIKIQDVLQGDQVVAIKIPHSNNIYQLVLKDDALLNTLHVYLADKDYGEVILGTVENLEYINETEDAYELLTVFKRDVVINTNLMNVNSFRSLSKLNL